MPTFITPQSKPKNIETTEYTEHTEKVNIINIIREKNISSLLHPE